MSKLYDKKQPGLLSVRMPLWLLMLCSYFLIAQLQSSVSIANQQPTRRGSGDLAAPEVYMPELMRVDS